MELKTADFKVKYLILCLLIFSILGVLLPHSGYDYDITCWKEWSKYSYLNGLSNIYNSDTNYLPLYHYILYGFSLLQNSVSEIEFNIFYLKIITLVFHFITGYFLLLTISTKEKPHEKDLFNVLFYLLNIAVLYNTIIWGQVDDILTCFIFISCYFSFKKRILPSVIFFLLALNFKLQAIIFLPVIGLILLPEFRLKFSMKKLIIWLIVPLSLQLLIVAPFIFSGTIDKLWAVVGGSVGKYPFVSLNAYNVWNIVLSPGNLMSVPDSNVLYGLSINTWGFLLFFSFSGIALLPLAKRGFLSMVAKEDIEFPMNKFLLICAIIPLLFFYFNTQMHERYSHPAFVFLIAYSIRAKKTIVAITGCLAYFLNLDSVLEYTNLTGYRSVILYRVFISSLYFITICLLYWNLFDSFLKNQMKAFGLKWQYK